MDGIINNDNEIIKHLDSNFNSKGKSIRPGVKSDIIPVSTNKNGSLSKNSKVAETKELKAIERYVTEVVKEYGRGILSGNLGVSLINTRIRQLAGIVLMMEFVVLIQK